MSEMRLIERWRGREVERLELFKERDVSNNTIYIGVVFHSHRVSNRITQKRRALLQFKSSVGMQTSFFQFLACNQVLIFR